MKFKVYTRKTSEQGWRLEGQAEISDRREYFVPDHLYIDHFHSIRKAMKALKDNQALTAVEIGVWLRVVLD